MKRPLAVDRPEPDDVLAHLSSRYSVSPKHLVAPAPGRAELMRAAALALRAPDHEALRPYSAQPKVHFIRTHWATTMSAGLIQQ